MTAASSDYAPPPGHVGNLTAAQQNTLDALRKEIQDEGWFVEDRMSDPALLRFLRARKFVLGKAKDMLKSCEEWRRTFGVDELVRNYDPAVKIRVDPYYPQYFHKTDKDGRPVYIETLAKLDIKALYQVTSEDQLLQLLVYEYERLLKERFPICSKAAGHPVETSCTILDLGGVSLTNFYHVKDYVGKAAAIGQDRYPECMGRFYIINAPWAFTAVWALIKPWLDEVTVKKVTILGSNYQKELLEQIPAPNLPKEYGGTCVCPGGCSLSDAGPWNLPQN